jgi:ketosteroid isomerase-like protein
MTDEILRVHEARQAALLAGDLEALSNYVAEDLIYTSPKGKVQDRNEVYAGFRAGTTRIERMDCDDFRVRINGDAAVVTYRSRSRMVDPDYTVDGLMRSTSVYFKRDGAWVLVAQHQFQLED